MANKKSAAPKAEPKAKVSKPLSSAKVVMVEASTGEISEVEPKAHIEETPVEEVAVKDQSSDLRFRVGDIAQHNGSNYLCIATNGQQCAVFVPASVQTTYSRVVEQKCLLMNNELVKA